MSFDEVVYFLEGYNKRNRETWEQTRILGYLIAQSNSTKKLKSTDILRFPWDDEKGKSNELVVSEEEKKRLREIAKQMENKLKD